MKEVPVEQRAKHVNRRSRASDSAGQPRKTGDERWADVLHVAAATFAKDGYSATSLQDIADRVGMLKGSLYYYINSKEDLLYEIIRGVLDRGIGHLEEILASPDKPVDRLRAAISVHVKHLVTHHVETTVFLHELKQLSPERRRQIPSARYEGIFLQLVSDAQAEGQLRAGVDPVIASRVILGACNWVYRWYRPQDVTDPDELAREMADQLLGGLVPQGRRGMTAVRTS